MLLANARLAFEAPREGGWALNRFLESGTNTERERCDLQEKIDRWVYCSGNISGRDGILSRF